MALEVWASTWQPEGGSLGWTGSGESGRAITCHASLFSVAPEGKAGGEQPSEACCVLHPFSYDHMRV